MCRNVRSIEWHQKTYHYPFKETVSTYFGVNRSSRMLNSTVGYLHICGKNKANLKSQYWIRLVVGSNFRQYFTVGFLHIYGRNTGQLKETDHKSFGFSRAMLQAIFKSRQLSHSVNTYVYGLDSWDPETRSSSFFLQQLPMGLWYTLEYVF
jgi:hypothetical protein